MKHESEIKKFPGYIVLPDNWNIHQLRAFEDTLPDADPTDEDRKAGRVWLGVNIEKNLPVVLACVSEWHIEGIPDKPTIDTFPVLPISAVAELVHWIYNLLVEMWMGEQVPNE